MTDSRMRAVLVLEDGSVYEGYSFGGAPPTHGEVVFATSMTGYQEMLTDPSFAGQIVVPTYPMIGNYGINAQDFESKRIQVAGFVVREECRLPSHRQSERTVDEYLRSQGVVGLAGVDTRALVRRLRVHGVMMGAIAESAEAATLRLKTIPRYDTVDYVKLVTAAEPYRWVGPGGESGPRIVVLDSGLKYNILRNLARLGCSMQVVPCTMPASDILKLNPDGIFFSPGPGDPALLDYLTDTVRVLIEKKPVMGICLGHQLIARALGGRTFKLKFGHRGANHPVKDLETGRVYITAQNHGYAVDADTLKGGLEVSQINLNDGTVEGLRHRELPLFTIQYHSEASPGPLDSTYLFERFVGMVKERASS